jgi:hypothetical protein
MGGQRCAAIRRDYIVQPIETMIGGLAQIFLLTCSIEREREIEDESLQRNTKAKPTGVPCCLNKRKGETKRRIEK